MTLEDSMHAFRLRVMIRAQQLGNVSKAWWEFGFSRSLSYPWRKRFLRSHQGYRPEAEHLARSSSARRSA